MATIARNECPEHGYVGEHHVVDGERRCNEPPSCQRALVRVEYVPATAVVRDSDRWWITLDKNRRPHFAYQGHKQKAAEGHVREFGGELVEVVRADLYRGAVARAEIAEHQVKGLKEEIDFLVTGNE